MITSTFGQMIDNIDKIKITKKKLLFLFIIYILFQINYVIFKAIYTIIFMIISGVNIECDNIENKIRCKIDLT